MATTVTTECKTCGAGFERAVRHGVAAAVVNCPACRGRKAKPAETPKARVEFRGPREGFFVITPEGVEVGHHPTKRAGAVAEAAAAGFEV